MVNLSVQTDATIVVDRAGRIVSLSSGARSLLGYGASALGERLYELLDGRDVFGNLLCPESCWLQEMARRGEPVQRFEIDVRHARGHRLRLVADVQPWRSEPRSCPTDGWIYRFLPDRRSHDGRRFAAFEMPLQPLPASFPQPAASSVAASPLAFPSSLASPPTRREVEVLGLLARGASTAEIARHLGISTTTARNHVQHLLGKLNVHSRLEAVSLALRNGLV